MFLLLVSSFYSLAIEGYGVRLKDLARVEGERSFALVGYGIVVGLEGSGDSPRNQATLQSLSNTLRSFGLTVDKSQISSRNAAAVMVTAEVPAFTEEGDRVDILVSSLGDARSLSGGTLLLTPLYGPDEKLYALGQGTVIVGGYKVEAFDDLSQKNHTTAGTVSQGAIIERASPINSELSDEIKIILHERDYTTAERVVQSIKAQLGVEWVDAVHPGKIRIIVPSNISAMKFMAQLEHVRVNPDVDARVVVNERTGTIVAGGNVLIGEVSISHGNLRIEIDTSYQVSQPQLLSRPSSSIQSVVVAEPDIKIKEDYNRSVRVSAGTSVADLVQSLQKINLSTRDIITILQSIKAAGALHAQLVIQ